MEQVAGHPLGLAGIERPVDPSAGYEEPRETVPGASAFLDERAQKNAILGTATRPVVRVATNRQTRMKTVGRLAALVVAILGITLASNSARAQNGTGYAHILFEPNTTYSTEGNIYDTEVTESNIRVYRAFMPPSPYSGPGWLTLVATIGRGGGYWGDFDNCGYQSDGSYTYGYVIRTEHYNAFHADYRCVWEHYGYSGGSWWWIDQGVELPNDGGIETGVGDYCVSGTFGNWSSMVCVAGWSYPQTIPTVQSRGYWGCYLLQ